eukprot:CAMPEP_0198120994 /NCGR_PEP_ID=MMETSP1442-20131203/30917_1 /TAXON_ID= /ORGANISM="Craspedostauros australis, Strain CCMP3328" /LENGTH=231 /DNA_ID=CAMNT_0043779739 /DNA_START=141 /DNA_END=836 /DNA_ORIENTATION=+
MNSANQSSDKNASVVSFNVGGKIFTVSTATLTKFSKSTLFRLANDDTRASPTSVRSFVGTARNENIQNNTSQDAQPPIFLDGNSTRFEYVLDYMRNDKVFLPQTIPREAFLNDLETYNIVANHAKIRAASNFGIARAVEFKKCMLEGHFMSFALWSRTVMIQPDTVLGPIGTFVVVLNKNNEYPFSFDNIKSYNHNKALFEDCLSEVGLSLVKFSQNALSLSFTLMIAKAN